MVHKRGVDEEVHRKQSEQMKEIMRGVGVVDAKVRLYPVSHLDTVLCKFGIIDVHQPNTDSN